MVIMKYPAIKFHGSLFISLSQFVVILYNAFWVDFYKEKQSEILYSYFY